jgi:hypothetical protein
MLLKRRGTSYMEGAYILVFIRNGANLAHFFRQMPGRKEEIIQGLMIRT